MNLVNLDRDMWWHREVTLAAPGAQFAWGAGPVVRTDNVQYTSESMVMTQRGANFAGTPGNWQAYGLKMQWIADSGPVPYRVKGHCTDASAIFGLGWSADATQSATISDWFYLQSGRELDDIWNVRESAVFTASHYLVPFVMFPADAGVLAASLSCQRLLGKPPQYSSQVR